MRDFRKLEQSVTAFFKQMKHFKEIKIIRCMRKDLLLRAKTGKRLSPAASVTVEASIVLPIFIFFFVNVIGAFDILKLQCDMEAALHQTGMQIAETSAYTRMADEKTTKAILGDTARGVASSVYASQKVKSYLGDDYLEKNPIVGGGGGISFKESALNSDGDIIDIIASYKVHPMFGIAGFTDFGMESRFYGHGMTGYDPDSSKGADKEESEELVYITESGSVYHRSLSCTHLKIKVTSVPKSSVSSKRNKDRKKYYPCEHCGSRGSTNVYITSYGDKYHSDPNCSGLKRSIRTVPISEAAGRRPCSECG